MEIPKCISCDQLMFEIGGTGKKIQDIKLVDGKMEVIGMHQSILYQCPECKEVKIK